MTILLCILLLAFSLHAQPAGIVAGQLSIEGSALMKTLYGGKVPVLVGNVSVKNYTNQTVQISPADLYISLSTVDTVPASDAAAALTKVYDSSKWQRLGQVAQAGAAGVGIAAAASSPIAFGARTLGYLLFGSAEFQQAISIFSAGQPAISTLLANACDALPSGMALIPGGSFTCKIYVQKPANKMTILGAVAFQLVPNGPPAPGPLPAPLPVQLIPRKLVGNVTYTDDQTYPHWTNRHALGENVNYNHSGENMGVFGELAHLEYTPLN